jgi:RNA polymerase sigma-70 factor (ECF subfamily)
VCTECPARLARDVDGAFATLVDHHQDLVFAICRRLVTSRADAEDLAQDTFVRAYRALRGWPADRIQQLHLRGWLARICLNLGRNRARDLGVRGGDALPIDDAVEPHEPRSRSPERVAERRDEARRWIALLGELPTRYANAVALRHVDGLSYPELVEALDRPLNTVKSDVHRGVAMLREAYERDEARNHSADLRVVGVAQ